ncbi:MAG: magnesium transporter, partial [Phycisphaeraceae bacterium]
TATDTLDTLEDFFDAHYFNAVPVVDEQGKLLGVVRRAMVEEALGERADIQLLRFGGIIAGEELRTMPLGGRAMRRLAFLLPNILLSFIAVTIIAFYEASIEQIATLAVFLPLVANLSGAAGNQAVAVSIRELALGIVQPRDWLRVCLKEVKVGAINGVIIGAILCVIAALMMHGELMSLAWIVGGAYAMNSVLAVLIGGTLPLAAKALGADPAMISSPILTTLTDMGAFFLTLSMATTLVIAYLPPVT